MKSTSGKIFAFALAALLLAGASSTVSAGIKYCQIDGVAFVKKARCASSSGSSGLCEQLELQDELDGELDAERRRGKMRLFVWGSRFWDRIGEIGKRDAYFRACGKKAKGYGFHWDGKFILGVKWPPKGRARNSHEEITISEQCLVEFAAKGGVNTYVCNFGPVNMPVKMGPQGAEALEASDEPSTIVEDIFPEGAYFNIEFSDEE